MRFLARFRTWTVPVTVTCLLACGGIDTRQVDEARSSLSRENDPQVSASDATTVAQGNAAFAFDLYAYLAGGSNGSGTNLVYSPASISIALAMTYAGAVGTTATEMAETMHFSLAAAELHPAFNALDLALAGRNQVQTGTDGRSLRLVIANALWGQEGKAWLPAFLDTLAVNYGAGMNLANFRGAPEAARVTINQWVADQTEQKIQNLLQPGTVDTTTRLVLTNAVYFDGPWQTAFDASKTVDQAFHRLDGSTSTAKMMNTRTLYPAMLGDGFSALALPYSNSQLSLLVVVPDLGSFAQVEQGMTAPALDAVVAGLQRTDVILSLPRFAITYAASLATALQSLGIASAFSASADFSGMDGLQDLSLHDVVHKALIEVSESGTVAAAATAATTGILIVIAQPPTPLAIVVDRPFLFFLRDEPTGAVLFMGRVLDPAQM
jgi:serpin B